MMHPTVPNDKAASIILAAGQGSRMKGYEGSKALLPLIPEGSPYSGRQPILLNILNNLPPGPKAVIINHAKGDIIRVTRHLGINYFEQPVLNGTGGALLAARSFLEKLTCKNVLITMGDVPFVAPDTYLKLIKKLEEHDLVVLGFKPRDKKQYGVLEIHEKSVHRIIEWKYWKDYARERQNALSVCNSGIYAARIDSLIASLSVLASKPHVVQKEIAGIVREHEEFFITDLVEYLPFNGHSTGYIVSEDENEVMGVDDPSALAKAQEIYRKRF